MRLLAALSGLVVCFGTYMFDLDNPTRDMEHPHWLYGHNSILRIHEDVPSQISSTITMVNGADPHPDQQQRGGSSIWRMHLIRDSSSSMARSMARLIKSDMTDVLGAYLETRERVHGWPVFKRIDGSDLWIWHTVDSGWYCGERKNLGTDMGMLYAYDPGQRYKFPPGGSHQPIFNGVGWTVPSPSGVFDPIAIEFLNMSDLLRNTGRGARVLQLWDEDTMPPLRLGVPRRGYWSASSGMMDVAISLTRTHTHTHVHNTHAQSHSTRWSEHH